MGLLKDLRMEAGITQVGFASRCGVSKQHIMRIEQGLYQRLPEHIALEYARISNETITQAEVVRRYDMEVQVRYENLRDEIAERASNHGGWQHFLDTVPSPSNRAVGKKNSTRDGSNLAYFREFLGYDSRIGFCRAFAVHPATVLHYEKGQSRRLPSDLEFALQRCYVPKGVVDVL